ncbi:hypothetical protein GCM10009692_22310 [Leucobacter aridicollis]
MTIVNRVQFAYFKAWLMLSMGLGAVILVFVGGGPRNYPTAMLFVPLGLLIFGLYFCWEAWAFKKQDDDGSK